MNPPLCPLGHGPMTFTVILDGREHFKCLHDRCSVEASRPEQPTPKPTP